MFTNIYEKTKKFILLNIQFLIAIVVFIGLFSVQLPYVIYTPGGVIDLEDRIVIDDKEELDGKLQMAYVSMLRGSIPFLTLSFILPNWDIVKKSDVTYEDETIDEMIKRDQLYLQESIDNAIIASFTLAGKEIIIKNTLHTIYYIDEKAVGNLKLYDEIIDVDGNPFTDLDEFLEYIEIHELGDYITLKVKRNDQVINIDQKVININNTKKIGIGVVTTFEYETNPEVKITSKKSESGSSGGLMLALSIYSQINEIDLTKGRNIVGTGTIDKDGNVGEIGGVKYKLLGAVKNKADIFLCPVNNLKEAREVAEENNFDIKIIGVKTLEEAVLELS